MYDILGMGHLQISSLLVRCDYLFDEIMYSSTITPITQTGVNYLLSLEFLDESLRDFADPTQLLVKVIIGRYTP